MKQVTIVIPAHNEEKNVALVTTALDRVMSTLVDINWNVLFVDDGSRDGTLTELVRLSNENSRVGYIELSRNFGKEIATTAGLHAAEYSRCDAVILMDADLQHPPEYLPSFLQKWSEGADMVIGVRSKNHGEGHIKRIGSQGFNWIMKRISETEYVPRSTDFRLISRPVLSAFTQFTERGRITRGLLDWLGFRKVYVEFEATERVHGVASYNVVKLLKLAVSSFLSHSLFPLKIAGYLGLLITLFGAPVLCFMMVDRYVIGDPFHFNFSGPAILALLSLTLIGIVLMCLGLVALYIGTIHTEAMNRPLYVIREKRM